jgi:nitrogen regulatory protein PII
MKRVALVFSIVDRGRGDDVCRLLRENGVTFNLISVGYGASGLGLVDYLGLTDFERDITLSVVQADRARGLLQKLLYKLDLDEPYNGIAFAVPISGVSGGLALRYISGNATGNCDAQLSSGGAAVTGEQEFSLILTVVNRGFADVVIEAAKEAGARGGTVYYARGTGVHEVEKFFAISIQPEKEVVMTLVKKAHVQTIMREIVRAAGLKTEGRGLAFALPVTDVVGVSVFQDEDA